MTPPLLLSTIIMPEPPSPERRAERDRLRTIIQETPSSVRGPAIFAATETNDAAEAIIVRLRKMS